jgi:hypothetical protein
VPFLCSTCHGCIVRRPRRVLYSPAVVLAMMQSLQATNISHAAIHPVAPSAPSRNRAPPSSEAEVTASVCVESDISPVVSLLSACIADAAVDAAERRLQGADGQRDRVPSLNKV